MATMTVSELRAVLAQANEDDAVRVVDTSTEDDSRPVRAAVVSDDSGTVFLYLL